MQRLSWEDTETGEFGIPTEAQLLCASRSACALADAWQALKNDDGPGGPFLLTPLGREEDLTGPLEDALGVIELATRPSPLRKVRP